MADKFFLIKKKDNISIEIRTFSNEGALLSFLDTDVLKEVAPRFSLLYKQGLSSIEYPEDWDSLPKQVIIRGEIYYPCLHLKTSS